MERELFRLLQTLLRRLGRRRRNRRFAYTDAAILEVYLWAVLHDRPVSWACDPRHWPKGVRRGPLPSQSQVSRRMRSPELRQLRRRLEQFVLRRGRRSPLVCVIDGKPLVVAAHSTDPHARFGRVGTGKSKGYKLHALIDLDGVVWAWCVAPLNADERTIAPRLLRRMPGCCYLLADKNYDANHLFARAAEHATQLIAPRRYGVDAGLGHRPHHPGRLRSRDMLENRVFDFGTRLHRMRGGVERYFSALTSFGGGLTCLPSWVRTHPRVQAFVQAKLIIRQLRTDLPAARKAAG